MIEQSVDRAAAVIWNLAEDHQETWQDAPTWKWYLGLVEEVAELGLALLGLHKHRDGPNTDTVDWELRQIGSIALNWIRKRDES